MKKSKCAAIKHDKVPNNYMYIINQNHTPWHNALYKGIVCNLKFTYKTIQSIDTCTFLVLFHHVMKLHANFRQTLLVFIPENFSFMWEKDQIEKVREHTPTSGHFSGLYRYNAQIRDQNHICICAKVQNDLPGSFEYFHNSHIANNKKSGTVFFEFDALRTFNF